MYQVRVIPCLLLKDGGLVKTTRFDEPVYLGDPVNIVKLFNDMEVDELGLLDIAASAPGGGPAFDLLQSIADEAFMPLSYGGGIVGLDQVRRILGIGYEKVVIGLAAAGNPRLVEDAARAVGNQSIVVSIDARRGPSGGYEVFVRSGRESTRKDPAAYAREMEQRGAGEILLTAIDRDGTMAGYDLELIRRVSDAVRIPVIASGGAGKVSDFAAAIRTGGASAVAAGSLFVFYGRRRAVLVNFPRRDELEAALGEGQAGPAGPAA